MKDSRTLRAPELSFALFPCRSSENNRVKLNKTFKYTERGMQTMLQVVAKPAHNNATFTREKIEILRLLRGKIDVARNTEHCCMICFCRFYRDL